MSYAFLKELRDLSVVVVHPLDEEGKRLTDHLRRIGCEPQLIWPVPLTLPSHTDVLLIRIEGQDRAVLRTLTRGLRRPGPTILAIVSYEDPTTLQLVLESGAIAVLGRPIRPFGLLTNLAIARKTWRENRDLARDARQLKRRANGDRITLRAKSIIMAEKGLSEDQAHTVLRGHAMERRLALEVVAREFVERYEAGLEDQGGNEAELALSLYGIHVHGRTGASE